MIDIPAYLESLLCKAYELRASDIHIQPYAHQYGVRFRIDGHLLTIEQLDVQMALQLIGRIKVLSQADVAEQRRPQDGMFIGNQGDVRVATFPSIHGEKVVLRLLAAEQRYNLDSLGLHEDQYRQMLDLIQQQGFFLATGPTGSGKTTTLHALLSHLASSENNCVTLEDPVEYTIDGVTQTQVHPEIGLTFEKGLRALLRQDPDTIMVGEIRDTSTAHVALHAALTGHTVLSSLHTTDAPAALVRLAHMGCERYLIAAGVKAVIAQRLLRKLCVCKKKVICTQEHPLLKATSLYEPQGCDQCTYTGYKGRVGIFQLMVVTPEIRKECIKGGDYDDLKALATEQGMLSLPQSGAHLVQQGTVSYAEWLRLR